MEVATFFAEDPEPLVRASLSCPLCLGSVESVVDQDDSGFLVHCRCGTCGHERSVGLTDAQAMRLVVVPLV